MNVLKYTLIIAASLASNFISAGGVVDTFKKAAGVNLGPAGEQLFVDLAQEKKNQLQKVVEARNAAVEVHKKNAKAQTESIEETQNVINRLERTIQRYPNSSFFNKQLALQKELNQVLKDKPRVEEDLLALQESLITLLTQFIEDPEFTTFKKERRLEERVYYSFDDLHLYQDMIVNQERMVAQLAEQEKNTLAEQDSRRRMLKATEEEHAKRVEELQKFSEQTDQQGYEYELSLEQQEKELIAIEERLYRNKKDLYDLYLQQSKYALDKIQLRVFIERTHLDLLRQHLRQIKIAIRVNEPDISYAKEQLNTYKKEYFARREQYQKERDNFYALQRMKERYRDMYAKEHNIPLGRDLDEWSREPKQTISSYIGLAMLGALNAEVQWLQIERDLLETQRSLEDEKYNYMMVQTHAKETYYKISNRKYLSAEEITQEIKNYETQKADAQATLSICKERISTVADLLSQNKKIIDNINAWRERVARQQEYLFKDRHEEYVRMLELLNNAEENIKRRIDVLGKLTGVYSGLISEINATIRLLGFIINELQSITIWYRPEYAIAWNGIKNIPNDMFAFFGDLRAYVVRGDIGAVFVRIAQAAQEPLDIVVFCIKLLLLLLVLFMLYQILPRINRILVQKSREWSGLLGIGALFLRVIIQFFELYFIGLACWAVGAFICMLTLNDPYLYSIFCLLSIPYFLYLAHRFTAFLFDFNVQHGYILLSLDFQERFIVVLSVLLYASIIIFWFRQAFMRISYYRTELPTILLAINFIIFQIALIFLITKDQILSIIPTRNEVWLWFREQVDRYFYLILLFVITVIVMSNPYVGFGRLVLYLISSMLYTLLLIKALLALHSWIKNLGSYIFFTPDEEVTRERFDHARTWFGLMIITSFFVFTFLGVLIGAKIWGWQIGFKDVTGLMTKPLLLEATTYPVTLLSVLQIIAFILAGFVAAYAINRFVLDRIFDLLLVDPGVQYTTIRFIQYSVVIIFVFFGFKNVGLGDLVGYILGALALGIGWYVREPIGDLVAYFLILVQRPLKVGDFIQMDQEIFGVVRKITPRAVVIRRRNSTTIVIPNSHIMNRAIINWNYVRNFIAFNDILLIVTYKEDPNQVKDLLMQAVSAHPNVLRNPKPIVRLEDYGEFGYVFMVRGFISSAYTLDMWDIASDVRLLIAKTFKEHNVEVAEFMRITRNDANRLAQISPQQRESTERKVRE